MGKIKIKLELNLEVPEFLFDDLVSDSCTNDTNEFDLNKIIKDKKAFLLFYSKAVNDSGAKGEINLRIIE